MAFFWIGQYDETKTHSYAEYPNGMAGRSNSPHGCRSAGMYRDDLLYIGLAEKHEYVMNNKLFSKGTNK